MDNQNTWALLAGGPVDVLILVLMDNQNTSWNKNEAERIHVLILVLMDNQNTVTINASAQGVFEVLILVLMDNQNTRRLCHFIGAFRRLNPCSNG